MNLAAFPQFFKKINQLISPTKINHHLISDAAIDIVLKLQENDFEAYIVGGAIRDILLDHPPKDFDIATNAKPEDIRKIFKYSRIIGRRFKLVHVIYNRETIEVSTFRTAPTEKIHMKNGILKDNEYGSMSEDIKRRDFTINALYYDPINKKLIDTLDGKGDIKKKIVRLIGDPQKRFAEDPIRVLRALRFTAKLHMGIHNDTLKHIKPSMNLLETIPHSRLFDEILKFFLTGHAKKSLIIFREYNLTKKYLPAMDSLNPSFERFVFKALDNCDQRIANNKHISPGFIFSVFLWQDVFELWKKNEANYSHSSLALNDAIDKVIIKQNKIFPIQKRFLVAMSEIWRLQIRFENLTQKKVYRLFTHPRFRAAYDFMLIRSESDQFDKNLSHWWEKFVTSDENTRKKLIKNKIYV
ncbi:polynucleotide adenylyltransferase PcnB [Methylophilales bacterium]|nr:polynucleotide adenylyltransferase PcnB [Methylophilales bacterium]